MYKMDYRNFYRGKRVFVTGHSGFKGTWMCKVLADFGAVVAGYGLDTCENYRFFEAVQLQDEILSIIGDVRDREKFTKALCDFQPDIVMHLAAQPIVSVGYSDPVGTYETNILGTLYLMDAVRTCGSVKSVVHVTSDKVYQNKEWCWGYREIDCLDGFDPYSNSKSCSELLTACYTRSFLQKQGISVSTVRAGNVIGGGDFSKNRIIPDCFRAAAGGKTLVLRSPASIRPYQFVLDVIFPYLRVAQAQYENGAYAGSYNIGPYEEDCVNTLELVKLFANDWGSLSWDVQASDLVESNYLKLDCSHYRQVFQAQPVYRIEQAVRQTVQWYRCYQEGGNIARCMENQIADYMEKACDRKATVVME